MSVTLMRLVRDNRHPDVTPAMKLTLMTLASHHWEKEPENGTRVTTRRLAADTGFGLRAVQKHLVALESLGLIERSLPEKRTWVRLGANVGSRETNVGSPLRNQGPRQEEEHQGPKGPGADALRGGELDPRLTDPDADVLDERPKKKPKRQVPEQGTVEYCWRYFDNLCKSRWGLEHNGGHLKRVVAVLRDGHDLSYDDIVKVMDYWAVREDAVIRQKKATSREPLQPAQFFHAAVKANLVQRWRKDTSTAVNTNRALGAKSLNEKMGLA